MTPQERKAFADAADEAIAHPLARQVIEEYRQNMRSQGVSVERGTVAYWGLLKCLNAVAQTARAQALGIDPHDLIMTDDEANAHRARMAQAALEADKPVIVFEGEPPERDEEEEAP